MEAPWDIPPSWQTLAAADLSGTILVVGAPSSGKSTFVRWLVEDLCRTRRRIGWLDGDVGQTTLGVPGTMNLAVVDAPLAGLPQVNATFFVGSTSPRGHMLPTVVGLQRLQQAAVAEAATVVVVDTTGLIAEQDGGGSLKLWKVELLRPALMVAIQRENELVHILTPLIRERYLDVRILKPSDAARCRSPQQREQRRRELYRRYFESAAPVLVCYSDLAVYGIDIADRGSLLALQNEAGFSLGLGIALGIEGEKLQVLTPLTDISRVTSLRFGSLKLNPSTFEEMH
jgi:polynucleotide 5'-hydroxyl-kinase GRC3/NOL9